jgi:homoserine O-acetyltransferase
VQQRLIADTIPTVDRLRLIDSPYGHDAFLIETEQVAALVTELLGPPEPGRAGDPQRSPRRPAVAGCRAG